jgi:hypothetical protein
MSIATATLLLAGAPPAQARARRISLSLPSTVDTGARVVATGRVPGASRGRRVFVQRRHGKRWTTLASTRVSHGKFRAVFLAPNLPEVMIVRAVLYRNRRRRGISQSRRLVIRARATTPVSVAPALGGMAIAGWGDNGHGELGAGYKSVPSPVPVPVPGLLGIKAVAATYFTSYALMSDGTVRSWGGNMGGQLGAGTREAASTAPVSVLGLSRYMGW